LIVNFFILIIFGMFIMLIGNNFGIVRKLKMSRIY